MFGFDDVFNTATDVLTLGATKYGRDKRRAEQAASRDRESGINAERLSLLEEGMSRGRERSEELLGQGYAQTGADIQDIIRRRRENIDTPSRAASEIRARGQQTARRTRAAGGSEAQQRQVEIESARAAGIQDDMDKERRLQDFQSLMGNVLATQSSLEPAYGKLMLASQYIAPEERDQGALGNLFQGLGL